MRIKITKGGIFTSKGEEIPVGAEIDVKSEPLGWAGRYEIIGNPEGKTLVTGDAPADVEKMTVAELQAFLTSKGVAFTDEKKPELLALAREAAKA